MIDIYAQNAQHQTSDLKKIDLEMLIKGKDTNNILTNKNNKQYKH